MNGIKASLEGDSTKLEFNGQDLRYPLCAYFFKNEEIVWSTEIKSSGMWCSSPSIRGLDSIVTDIEGRIVFRHEWNTAGIKDSIEEKFKDWCRNFILENGSKPDGIVIGACDGIAGEWVSANNEGLIGKALLIEPNAKPFLSLLKRYGGDGRFSFRKVAVGDSDGFVDFYTDDSERVESSSLIESHYRKHMHSNNRYVSESIKKITVRCVTAEDLMKEGSFGWMHIDAEGYDARIIDSIDDARLCGFGFLIWEHSHLDAEQRDTLRKKLENIGFSVLEGEDSNSCAYRYGR